MGWSIAGVIVMMGWIIVGVIALLLCIGAIYGLYCLMGGREID